MQSTSAAEPVRKQLDRILSSAGFVRNERLSGFLRFIVQRHLEGKTGEIKESVVGVEVFGRAPGYDTRSDSVVRTEAAKLRRPKNCLLISRLPCNWPQRSQRS